MYIQYNSTYAQCMYVQLEFQSLTAWSFPGLWAVTNEMGRVGSSFRVNSATLLREREDGRERERERCAFRYSVLIYACRQGYVPTAQREALT